MTRAILILFTVSLAAIYVLALCARYQVSDDSFIAIGALAVTIVAMSTMCVCIVCDMVRNAR